MIDYSNPPDSKRRHNSPAITGERYPRNDVKLPSPKTLNCVISPVFTTYNLQTENTEQKYSLPLVSYQGIFFSGKSVFSL